MIIIIWGKYNANPIYILIFEFKLEMDCLKKDNYTT
jgi:hypothetical protein